MFSTEHKTQPSKYLISSKKMETMNIISISPEGLQTPETLDFCMMKNFNWSIRNEVGMRAFIRSLGTHNIIHTHACYECSSSKPLNCSTTVTVGWA
jgi:hypothetical protein